MVFESWPTITSNLAFQLADADLYIFGVLVTRMHALWLKTVGGRKGQSIRYTNILVYNTFACPNASNLKKRKFQMLLRTYLK